MKPFHFVITIIFFLFINAAFAQHYKITVTITGLRSDKGKVYLTLYNSAKGYPKEPLYAYKKAFSTIVNHTSTIILEDIPKGTYAFACIHDENDNKKLDKNFLGIPVEGVAASNNAKIRFGPPKFRDAQFVVDNDISQTIKIIY